MYPTLQFTPPQANQYPRVRMCVHGLLLRNQAFVPHVCLCFPGPGVQAGRPHWDRLLKSSWKIGKNKSTVWCRCWETQLRKGQGGNWTMSETLVDI